MKLLNCNKNAAILFLALVAFALVSFNVYLLGNLQRKEKWESERRPVKYTVELPKLNLDYKSLPADSSGQYKMQLKFLRPKIRSSVNQFDVSLVSHCTSNHLHYLLDLANHWKGPISLAVFVPGHDIVSAFRSLYGIYQCSEAFRDRITVHLVYPTSHPPAGNVLKPHLEQALRQLQGSCKEIVARLRNKKEEQKEAWNYANVKVPYPNNLLRNVGRSSISQMSYVFVVDVDLLCNGNLYHGFLQLAEHLKLPLNNNDKRVFVVPAFESADKLPPSLSKRDLIKLWDAETVRPFYYKACWKCQRHLGYDAWRSFHSSRSGLQVAYTVEWKDPWEPFYIGPNSVPRYDERFKQYGFNRISQVCETHFAGYDFVILDDAFVIHHGLKPKEGFHSSKNEENSKNREIFRTFKKELKSKYPQSTRHC